MKRIIIIFVFFTTILNANNRYELKLYEKVLPFVFHKTPLIVFADKDANEILKYSKKFKIVTKCKKAVVILIGSDFLDIPDECKDKPIFSTSYRSFKNSENSFGAFYWRKGRPQIKFKNKVLEKYNLTLPNFLRKYAK